MISTIAVIGANLAGGRAVESLRQEGFDGRIVLIGEEPWPPYERPSLSKEYLWLGGRPPENFYLQSEDWYVGHRIERRLGARADALDLVQGGVSLNSGEFLAADRILLATGGSVRRLPLEGGNAPNVHYLRTKDDADALAVDLRPAARIVVIGMGVIGCEVAASARKLGCDVVAIEPARVPMERTLGSRFGAWLGRYHQSQGVDLRLETAVSAFRLGNGRVQAVILDNGESIACDAVVAGIGIEPRTELARNAGLSVSNGIVTNQGGQTSNPVVYAAGDVAFSPGFFGDMVRLETYQNAADQGANASKAMIGHGQFTLKPAWFWSDQFDLNIQAAGKINDSYEMVVRGELETNAFTAFFLEESVLVGVLTVNQIANMGIGRRLIEARKSLDKGSLGDSSVRLRELLK